MLSLFRISHKICTSKENKYYILHLSLGNIRNMWYTATVIDFCVPPTRDIEHGLCAKNFALHILSGLYSVLVETTAPI